MLVVEKDRRKAEKDRKFQEKKAAQQLKAINEPQTSKSKEKKAKQEAAKDEPLPEYVEETTPGEKKSMSRSELVNDYEYMLNIDQY